MGAQAHRGDFQAATPDVVTERLARQRPKQPVEVERRKVSHLGKRAEVTIDTTPGTGSLAVTVKGDKGAPVAMAQVIAMGAAITAQTPDELRDGTKLPLGDAVIPIYLRGALGGTTEIEGVRPGVHTVCAMISNGDAMAMKCAPVTVSAGKASITITVADSKP